MREFINQADGTLMIADYTDSISFSYDFGSDDLFCVKYRNQQKSEFTIKKLTKNLMNGKYCHPDDQSIVNRLCREMKMGQEDIRASFRFLYADDLYYWIGIHGTTKKDADGNLLGIIGCVSSSTELESLLTYMVEHINTDFKSNSFLEKYLEKLVGFFQVDAIVFEGYGERGVKLFQYGWSKKFCESCFDTELEMSRITSDFVDRKFVDLDAESMHKVGLDGKKIKRARYIHFENLSNQTSANFIFASCDKTFAWDRREENTLMVILEALVFSQERDITIVENKGLKTQLQKDTVTGLSRIESFFEEAYNVIMQDDTKKYAVINSGFYNFQYINDNFGYAIGDAVFNRFGKFIQNNMKNGKVFARGSGDQFVFLIEFDNLVQEREKYIAYCKRFCNEVEKEIGINSLVISSGMCEVDSCGSQKISKAVDDANIIRKTIKKSAETNCTIFYSDVKENISERMRIAANMKNALDNEEFEVYYQPKIDLEKNEIIGAEALIRWIEPSGKMIYPDQFIPLFEENGFIVQIDFYVLQKVLIFLTKRKEKGQKMFPISVNFSRNHQENNNFVSDIVAILDEYKIERKWIDIEITESAFLTDIEKLHVNLEYLRKNNISVSIDDFGSGYSSLNLLTTVNANVIKIDKEFLNKTDVKSKSLFKYLIPMIKGMGYQTIAEGVETKEQVGFLREIGCEMAQGYYYAKPMAEDAFIKYCELRGL